MPVHRRIPAEVVARNIVRAADFLSHLPGVKRVWLFGSASKGRDLDWRSDLDFAVEGLAPEQLERTWSELYQRLDIDVDLVRWETASALVQDEVNRWGKILYET